MLFSNIIYADVICEHTREGEVIPIRCRFDDEDGVSHEYNIIGFKELIPDSNRYVNGKMFVAPHSIVYDCKRKTHNTVRLILLLYNSNTKIWEMRY